MAILSSASKKRPLQLVGLGLFALLLASCGPGGCGSTPTSTGTTSMPTAIPTDTTTATASSTPSPTATHAPTPTHAPTATATHAAPTPTPLPPLQAVLLYDNLTPTGTGPLTNSPIHDVTCPAGYLVAGGGINSGYTNFTIMVSAPISTTTWRGEIYNNNTSGTIYAQLQVICLKVSGLTSQIVTVPFPGPAISSGTASAASATCPSGYLLAGGGVSSGYANFTHSVDSPGSTTRWDATVTNHSGSDMYAQLQIVCLRVSGLHSTLVHASLGTNIVNGANTGGHDAVCPAGYLVAGGGMQVSYPDYTTMFSAPLSTTKWRGAIHNDDSGTMPYQYVVATCLKRS